MSIRVLVCGGRHYCRAFELCDALSHLDRERTISCVIAGGASGADSMAVAWARMAGIPHEVYTADWSRLGAMAGPRRNQRMLDEGKPDVVVAFPGGRGTADMVARAKRAGVDVLEFD